MRGRCLKIIAVIAIVPNVILIILLVTFVVINVMGSTRSQMEMSSDGYTVKEDVEQIMEELHAFDRESAETEKIQKELNMICERESTRKPAMHLILSKTSPEKGNLQTIQWKPHFDSTTSSGGLVYESGGIKVPFAGYYYIYTTIRYGGNGTKELDYGRIIHNVFMKKSSDITESPTVLMQNFQSTSTIRRGKRAFTTSILGATFFLHAHSTVLVNSSLVANIDISPLGSYFGLFLM